MTGLGKILVFVNLVLATLMASWAIGLYTNRINWTGKAWSEGMPSMLTPRIDRIKQLNEAVGAAEANQRAAYVRLDYEEKARAALQPWYAALNHRIATGASPQNPILGVVLTGGQIAFDTKTNYPQVQPINDRQGRPLLSLDHYQAEIAKAQAETAKTLKDLDDLVKKDTELTNELVGERQGANIVKKGLRDRLADERAKIESVIAEREALRPLLVNAEVQTQLLVLRKAELDRRLGELGRTSNSKP
jgi:hypothetical protein